MIREKKVAVGWSFGLLLGLAAFAGDGSVPGQGEEAVTTHQSPVASNRSEEKVAVTGQAHGIDTSPVCRPGSFEAVISAKVPPSMRPANRDYSGCH